MSKLLRAVRYLWNVSAGYRLRPWRSPYIRWRLETYFGASGDVQNGQDFCRLLWQQRRELGRFLGWVAERQAEQKARSRGARK